MKKEMMALSQIPLPKKAGKKENKGERRKSPGGRLFRARPGERGKEGKKME